MMTNQDELGKLALDPQAFDTRLRDIHRTRDEALKHIRSLEDRVHAEAGDTLTCRGGDTKRGLRSRSWGMSLDDALDKADPGIRQELEALWRVVGTAREAIGAATVEYWRNPWPRFFPVEPKAKGERRIHGSLDCRTLFTSTRISWAPELAGKPAREAVEAFGQPLCHTCFPFEDADLYSHSEIRSQETAASRKPTRARSARTRPARPARNRG